jgi:hypothetical protein
MEEVWAETGRRNGEEIRSKKRKETNFFIGFLLDGSSVFFRILKVNLQQF